MRRTIASLAAGLLLAAALAGCGSDANGGPSGSDAANEPIVVTFEGGDVTPKGERVTVNQGEVTFEVTADEPGAIHVHSSPEQEFDYEAGTHDYTVALDTPGVVEVESHDLDVVIVQLEVN
jgi:hypothetical protein